MSESIHSTASPSATVPCEICQPEAPEGEANREDEPNAFAGDSLDLAESEHEKRQKLPWWKRPSPVWLLIAVPFTAAAMSSTAAPRVEIYTILACNAHKPEYSSHRLVSFVFPPPDVFSFTPFHHDVTFDNAYLNDSVIMGSSSHTDDSDSEEKRKLCASDPVVQAAVAKLSVAMGASMGILSCFTSAWWGSVSDRRGRTFVMAVHMIGLLLTDLSFISASFFTRHIPGGYWFLVLGPIAEGALGGFVAASASIHAYLADCTTRSSRSGIFSLMLGLIFTGMAAGPTLGSLLIRATKQTISVFYVASAVHLLYTILLCIFLPESLSNAQMAKSRQRHSELQDANDREWESIGGLRVLVRARRAFRFLSPLGIFWPHIERNANPLKARIRDWRLTLLVLAYGCTISIAASQTFIFQYAASTFGWNSEILGYWLTLVSITRAVYMTFVLPVIIKYLKPKPALIQMPVEPGESTPLITSSATASTSQPSTPNSQPLREKEALHSAAFDLSLARVSVVVDIISYGLMALIPTPVAFTVFAMMSALGSGFSPAIYSVALDMYARRGGTETGTLFGALSVVQALSSGVLGPAVYGFTYMMTVETFRRAFFFLVVVAVTTSFICLSLVRLEKESSIQDMEDATQSTLVDVSADDVDDGGALLQM